MPARVGGPHRSLNQYQELVLHLLDTVLYASEDQLPWQAKVDFFHEAQQSFGRTVLVLSGGAAFGECVRSRRAVRWTVVVVTTSRAPAVVHVTATPLGG